MTIVKLFYRFRAMDYKRMMKEKNLTQIELARKLGISRVRVTRYLNLLRLPKAQLNYIMRNGKEEKITERKLILIPTNSISP